VFHCLDYVFTSRHTSRHLVTGTQQPNMGGANLVFWRRSGRFTTSLALYSLIVLMCR